MNETLNKELIFDRDTSKLSAPNFKSLLQARLMQASMIALTPLRHLGISRLHAAINVLLKPDTFTIVTEGLSKFRYPSADYYWNRLLMPGWNYEPEIDLFLRRTATIPFVFLDMGANFGFWSERVGAGCYGEHKVIAVEASEYSLQILEANVKSAYPAVKVIHAAVEAESGKRIPIFGERHAGFSIMKDWPGASPNIINEVETISIDDLLEHEKIDAQNTPVVVKLDIEGAELLALKGGLCSISGDSIFLLEDADKTDISDAVRFAHDILGMSLYTMDHTGFEHVNSLEQLRKEKAKSSRIGQTGFNLLATSSGFWQDVMAGKTENLTGVG